MTENNVNKLSLRYLIINYEFLFILMNVIINYQNKYFIYIMVKVFTSRDLAQGQYPDLLAGRAGEKNEGPAGLIKNLAGLSARYKNLNVANKI